jgi:hypothetical protein
VGDVVYVRDPDLTGAFKVDGGERLYSIRECLVWMSVRGVKTKQITDADAMAMAKNYQRISAGKNLVVPKKEIELVTQ